MVTLFMFVGDHRLLKKPNRQKGIQCIHFHLFLRIIRPVSVVLTGDFILAIYQPFQAPFQLPRGVGRALKFFQTRVGVGGMLRQLLCWRLFSGYCQFCNCCTRSFCDSCTFLQLNSLLFELAA